MVMGPTHAMSGAAVWLTATALGTSIIGMENPSVAVIFLGTAVIAGAALFPDLDSNSATAVRSFGVFGTLMHQIVDGVSVLVYNLTRTKYDGAKTNGHRTLMHTAAMAIAVGALVSGLSSFTTEISIFGKTFALGQLFSLFTMFVMLHLGIAGLFEKQVKKMRKSYGVYSMMLASLLLTSTVAIFLPAGDTLPWLGLCVSAGMLMHCLGDAITKMGVPLLWPLKIRGKRWWDITLPALLRIRAGGTFEYAVLLPVLTLVTIVGAIYHIPGVSHVAENLFSAFMGLF